MERENTKLQNSFADQLRVEGINFKGYGIIPKYVMIDADLSLEAKGIYAYFCSFSGNGNAAFPSRDKIVYDLGVNKDTYYKHFQMLVNQGYITVRQICKKGVFTNNVYTLVSNPKKVQLSLEADAQKYSKVTFERMCVSGLKAWGYGMIPKAVMVDQRLPLKAKGIYAYFASFSGNGGYAFPKKELIQHHLGISEPTYYKFYSLLTSLNYITAVQRHVEGRKQINDYFLNDMPDDSIRKQNDSESVAKKTGLKNLGHGESREKTGLKNLGHGESREKTGLKDLGHGESGEKTELKNLGHGNSWNKTGLKNLGHGENSDNTKKKQDLKIWDTEKQDTEKQDTVISDTKSNSIKSNSIKSNNPSLSQIDGHTVKPEDEGGRELYTALDVKEELLQNKGIPFSYKLDEQKLTEAIHIMTEWDIFYPNGYKDQLRQHVYNLFNEALIQMCMSDQLTLKGSHVTYANIIQRINRAMKFNHGIIDITDVSEVAIENYYQAASTTQIKYPIRYMQSCIWDALLSGNISMYSSLKREFGI